MARGATLGECPACGGVLSSSAHFCPRCGHRVSRGSAARRLIVPVIGVAVLAGIVSVAAYFGLKQGPAPPAPPPALTTAQVLAKVQPSVVTVNVQVFRSGKAYGSGFVYGNTGYVMTNAHVVDQAVSITVTDSAGTTHIATLIGVNRSTDVAVT